MRAVDGYLALNRANRDERAPAHAASPDHAVEQLVADPTSLSAVVRFDRPRLGDLAGLRGDDGGTYAQTEESFTHTVTHMWNHGLGQTVTALLAAGMYLTAREEHDSVPWDALPGQMVRDDAGEWRLRDDPGRLAASYTIRARRR